MWRLKPNLNHVKDDNGQYDDDGVGGNGDADQGVTKVSLKTSQWWIKW